MTPRPPAFVTAAASFGPAATFIPASMMGWLILRRSVTVVRSCAEKGLVFESEEEGRDAKGGARGQIYVEMPYWVDGMLMVQVYNISLSEK